MKNNLQNFFLVIGFLSASLSLATNLQAKNQLERVKGTNISLIPPSGFSETAKFSGFWKTGHVAYINVREVDLSFEKTVVSLPAFQGKNEKLSIQSCENQQQGKLCTGTLIDSGYVATKLLYVFPINKNRTVIVEGVVGDNEYKQTLEQVRTSLLTAIYTEAGNADPFEGSDYVVDRLAPFQFVHRTDRGFVFTKNEQFFSSNISAAFALFRSFTPLDTGLKTRAKEELFSIKSLDNFTIESEQEVKINGLKAYEITARGQVKMKQGSRLVYQVLVPTRSAYYVLRGVLDAENEKYLPVLKEMAVTFRKKE